jgi:hypothetical protein
MSAPDVVDLLVVFIICQALVDMAIIVVLFAAARAIERLVR